jgi:hypothetical protein
MKTRSLVEECAKGNIRAPARMSKRHHLPVMQQRVAVLQKSDCLFNGCQTVFRAPEGVYSLPQPWETKNISHN